MLTVQQQKKRADWYRELYNLKDWDPLPHIDIKDKEKHVKMRVEFLTKLIWPKRSKAIYKIRPYWPETVLHKVFSSLWLCYWPVVDWETRDNIVNVTFNF